jgi:(2Fe-2S) ferredoxin
MSKFKGDKTQDFRLEGRFLGFVAEPGDYKLKYLRIATAIGEYSIKLPKEQRSLLYRRLTPGEWIEVVGYKKSNPAKGTIKLKAYDVIPVASPSAEAATSLGSRSGVLTPLSPSTQPASAQPASAQIMDRSAIASKPACILICQKSDCCKRGSREVARALQAELSDQGLADQVTIKSTGCMKRCKEGANVVMPNKARYSRVRPETAAALVKQHFADAIPQPQTV